MILPKESVVIDMAHLDTLEFVYKEVEYSENDDITIIKYLFCKPLQVKINNGEMSVEIEAPIESFTVNYDDIDYEIRMDTKNDEYELIALTAPDLSRISVAIFDPPYEETKEEKEYKKLLRLREQLIYSYRYEDLKQYYNQIRKDISEE